MKLRKRRQMKRKKERKKERKRLEEKERTLKAKEKQYNDNGI